MKKLKPASWLIIILVLLAIFFWWACALPGWKDPYTGPLSPTNREEVFDPSCLPVEIRQGSDTALFLVHGLNHSPQCWEQWLPDFQAAGYDVYAPLISGFGTSIEDYEHSCYPQWYQSMKDQYLQVRSRYKHVVYIGHSLGGMMGLQLAEENHNHRQAGGLLQPYKGMVPARLAPTNVPPLAPLHQPAAKAAFGFGQSRGRPTP